MATTNIEEINRTIDVLVRETRWRTAIDVLDNVISNLPSDRRNDIEYLEDLKDYVLRKKRDMSQQDSEKISRIDAEIVKKTERMKTLIEKKHKKPMQLQVFAYVGIIALCIVVGFYFLLIIGGDLSSLETALVNLIRNHALYWLYNFSEILIPISRSTPAINSCFTYIAIFNFLVFAVSMAPNLVAKAIWAYRQRYYHRLLVKENKGINDLIYKKNRLISK